MIEALFTQALGLLPPWQVARVEFAAEKHRIDFHVKCGATHATCPACGAAAQPLHDRLERTWRHLDFDWTAKQTQTMHWLQRSTLKTARAWRLKEALRRVYATARSPDEARPLLTKWLHWARRCRLEPFKRLARTLTQHFTGILNGFQEGRHNGRVEAMNRGLQEARARARGYRLVTTFIAMAYLVAGKLKHLPASPFGFQAAVVPVPQETT